MPHGKFYQAVGRFEKSEARLRDVFSAFEKLERELQQHIKQLRLARIVRDAEPDIGKNLDEHRVLSAATPLANTFSPVTDPASHRWASKLLVASCRIRAIGRAIWS
jgi:hypothetical protein